MGSSVTISAMPSTANVGLIAASDYNAQLTSATFASLTFAPPTIVTPAAASPAPVTGTSTALSSAGRVGGGRREQPCLYMVQHRHSTRPGHVQRNGTNAAQDTTATFTKAGTYDFQVTIADTFGDSTTTSVVVTVNQTIASIALSPSGATVAPGGQSNLPLPPRTSSARRRPRSLPSPGPCTRLRVAAEWGRSMPRGSSPPAAAR